MFETKTFQDFKSHLTGITCLKCSKLTNVLKLTSPNNAANFLLPCSSDHFFNQEIIYFCVWRLAREVVKELTPETTTYWFVATRLSFLLSDKLFTNHGAARGKKAFSTFLPFLEKKNLFRSSNISLVCTSASLLLTDRFKVEMESNLSLVCTSRYHSEVNLIENCKKFYLPQTALIGFKFCRKWKFSILAALWSLPLVLVLPSPEQNKRIIETISTSTATIAIFIFL